jgi:hypothetical protein
MQQRARSAGFALLLAGSLASGCLVSFDGYTSRGSAGDGSGDAGNEGGKTGGAGKTSGGGKPSAGSDSGGDAGETPGGEANTAGSDAGGKASGGSAGAPLAGAGGSSSGSGGSGGNSGSGGTDPKSCPVNLKGPAMIEIPKAGGGFFCMDRTEVPNEDYAEFLASNPAAEGAECAINNSYQPDTSTACAPASYIDADASQWYRACSKAGTRKLPYGDQYNGAYCFGVDNPALAPGPVATAPNCEGGYDGLFDLSGNVAEWEDSCFGASSGNDQCLIRGGSLENAESTAPSLLCNSSAINDNTPSAASAQRNTKDEFIGFRCCYDF